MYVKRNNSVVELRINSRLDTCKPIYIFRLDFRGDQETAELVTQRLNKVIKETFEGAVLDAYDTGWEDHKKKRKYREYFNYPRSLE